MAESCDRAFGRYLKTLRERRKLSLDDVCSLSHTFPESIRKGYLSRCENGHQKPAFSKVIALSRIYEVPADVLVERMELDMELDRVGGPDTEGMSYSELTLAGKEAIQKGFRWNAYGYLRDAAALAEQAPLRPSFSSVGEQVACAQMSCGTAARSLGRHRFALHEFLYLEATGEFSARSYPVILDRISNCFLALGELSRAEQYSDQSILAAVSSSEREFLGYVYFSRARVALARSHHREAATYCQRAYRAYKAANQTLECARTLNGLSRCYFSMKRYRAARRSSEAAMSLAASQGQQRTRALSLITLGELDELDKRHDRAIKRWREAAAIGKELNDRSLRFKSEILLYRRALQDNEEAVARAIGRRLRKLAPSVPSDTEELAVFRSLSDWESGALPEPVSGTQQRFS